jgi:hypothetical protein
MYQEQAVTASEKRHTCRRSGADRRIAMRFDSRHPERRYHADRRVGYYVVPRVRSL